MSGDDARVLLMKMTKVVELARERLGRRPIVTVRHNDRLGDALDTLATHNILSAPVVITADALDMRLPEDDSNAEPMETLIGFFDVRDAVNAILEAVKTSSAASEPSAQHTSMLFWMRAIENVEQEIVDTPLIKILGYDAELMYTPNANTSSVHDLIVNGFFGGSASVRTIIHRVVLFEANGEISNLISQTDVVHWLADHDCKLPNSLQTHTLRDLGFGSESRRNEFVKVAASTATIECYRILRERNVSGAAVVENDGRIIGDVTNGDLRSLTREHFAVLGLPVAEFIALLHGTSYSGYAAERGDFTSAFFEKSRTFKKDQMERDRARSSAIDRRRLDLQTSSSIAPAGVFTVTLDDTFRYDWFSNVNKRRVYVVDGNLDVPLDVITLSDVLECAVFGHAHRGLHRQR